MHPWAQGARDRWMAIEPTAVSGRRVLRHRTCHRGCIRHTCRLIDRDRRDGEPDDARVVRRPARPARGTAAPADASCGPIARTVRGPRPRCGVGVCRTDLHIVAGDLPPHRRGVVPGHEVVGYVDAVGADATRFAEGERIGIPWLRSTCGTCRFCSTGRENLCLDPTFTGWDDDGGYAEYAVVPEAFAYRLPDSSTTWQPPRCFVPGSSAIGPRAGPRAAHRAARHLRLRRIRPPGGPARIHRGATVHV